MLLAKVGSNYKRVFTAEASLTVNEWQLCSMRQKIIPWQYMCTMPGLVNNIVLLMWLGRELYCKEAWYGLPGDEVSGAGMGT